MAGGAVEVERTLGIDLASKPERTAACLIRWDAEAAEVEQLAAGIDDDEINRLAELAGTVGIDVPFGWPDTFVAAITAHRAHQPWPTASLNELRYRRTDLFVWQKTKLPPLSVSTDYLGIPAFRVARLLSDWRADRRGAGKYVEVYPRAARNRWQLGKQRDRAELVERAPWLSMSAVDGTHCDENDDCFDALIASLVARAHARRECEPIPKTDTEAASREGWIALPRTGSLPHLIDGQ